MDDLRGWIDSAPVLALLLFVAAYAGLTVALVPGAIGSAAAGAIFGTAAGTALTGLSVLLVTRRARSRAEAVPLIPRRRTRPRARPRA